MKGCLRPDELGVTRLPRWQMEGFDLVGDSLHNAELACELIDAILDATRPS
jgi:glyceraldehyde-3-phosphate dehydrogenase (ferredoxin)